MAVKPTSKGKAPRKSRTGQQEMSDLAQAIIRSVGVGIYIVQHGNFVYVSPLFRSLTGYSEEELLGRYSLNYVYPEDRGMVRKMAIQSLKGVDSLPSEYRFISKNGELIWVLEMVTSTMYRGERATVGSFMDITERKQVEKKIGQIAEEWQTTFDSISDLVSIQDKDFKLVRVNKAYTDAFKAKPGELVGRHCYEVVHGTTCPVEDCPHGRTLKTKKPVTAVQFEPRLGIYLEVSTSPIFDANGGIAGSVHIARDITERKRIEEALQAIQKSQKALINATTSSTLLMDTHGTVIVANETMAQTFGKKLDELIGMNIYALLPPDVVQSRKNHVEQVVRTGKPAHFEDERFGRMIANVVYPVFDMQDKVDRLAVTGTDITELKQAEDALRASEEKLRLIFESISGGIIVLGLDRHILQVNEATARMLGYSDKGELVGQDAITLASLKELSRAMMGTERTLAAGVRNVEYIMTRKDGSEFPAELSAATLKDAKGSPIGFVVVVQDVTERKKAEEALRESEEKYRSLYLTMSEAVALHQIIYDVSGKPVDYAVIDVNPTYESFIGLKKEQVIGRKVSELTKGDKPPHLKDIERLISSGQPLSFNTFLPLIDKHIHVSLFSPAEGKFVTIFTDITERKQTEQRLTFMATHDALTGLPNRTLFTDRLTLALAHAQRSHHRLAVMMLDLDRFKDVNDTLGHDIGDQLLKDVSGRLTALLRKSDTVARMGGDEFMILLPEVTQADYAARVARKILDDFHQSFRLNGYEMRVTTSIGITIYPDDGEGADTLLKNADIAMYRAKELGRDNCRLFADEIAGDAGKM